MTPEQLNYAFEKRPNIRSSRICKDCNHNDHCILTDKYEPVGVCLKDSEGNLYLHIACYEPMPSLGAVPTDNHQC